MKNVKSIIGQPLAIEQIAGLFSHAALGGPLESPIRPRLVCGPSGTGKTHLLNLLCADLRDKGVSVVRVKDCDSIALQSGENTQSVIDALNDSLHGPVCLVLDEAQKIFKGSKAKSAMERDLCAFVFPHGDEVQQTIEGKIHGESVVADFRNLILILATNEKESMETSMSRQRGEFPFARRFSLVELQNYSQETMEKIIPSYLAKNGYSIGECAAGMVGRLHRGNMQALVAVTERLKERVFKKVVSKQDVIEACRLTDYLPRGLKKGEARLLDALTRNDLGKSMAQVISGHHGKLLDASIAHLLNQWTVTKKGEKVEFPLVALRGTSKLAITDNGKRYLTGILKDGFTL